MCTVQRTKVSSEFRLQRLGIICDSVIVLVSPVVFRGCAVPIGYKLSPFVVLKLTGFVAGAENSVINDMVSLVALDVPVKYTTVFLMNKRF